MADKTPTQSGSSRRRWSLKKKIVIILIIGIAFLLFLEISARVLDRISGVDPSARTIIFIKEYRSHPYLNVRFRPGTGGSNSKGFKGKEFETPKPKGRIRVACLGGSTTWGFGLKENEDYPSLLGEILKQKFPGRDIEVINAGVPTYHSLVSLVNLQCRVLPIEPDIICVSHGANDMWPIMAPGFKTDYTHFYKDFPGDNVFCAASGEGVPAKLFGWSRLFQILRYKCMDFRRKQDMAHYITPVPRSKWAREPAPGKDGIETFRRNMQSIVAVAREHNIKIVLGNFPFRKSALPTGGQGECYEKMNEVVTQIASSHGTPLAGARTFVSEEKARFQSDGVHLTAEGSRKQAEAFAEAIVKGKLITQN
ncbi:MAG: hypothetical protein E3J72_17660 [Planctomycetota bacterium]|nr:MAG: hypothetical protein E3J72_17660 [Planctomycetota bacterium]